MLCQASGDSYLCGAGGLHSAQTEFAKLHRRCECAARAKNLIPACQLTEGPCASSMPDPRESLLFFVLPPQPEGKAAFALSCSVVATFPCNKIHGPLTPLSRISCPQGNQGREASHGFFGTKAPGTQTCLACGVRSPLCSRPSALCFGGKESKGRHLSSIQAALGIFWLLGEAGSPITSNASCIQIGTRTILQVIRASKRNITWKKTVASPLPTEAFVTFHGCLCSYLPRISSFWAPSQGEGHHSHILCNADISSQTSGSLCLGALCNQRCPCPSWKDAD